MSITKTIRKGFRRLSHRLGLWVGSLLVIGAIAYTCWRIGAISDGYTSDTMNALGELFVLIGGIAGSYLASQSAFRSHARSAFRRLLSMYDGLGRIVSIARLEGQENPVSALSKVEAIASVHYGTARDALADWSDLVPSQVAELRESLRDDAAATPVIAGDELSPPVGGGAIRSGGNAKNA